MLSYNRKLKPRAQEMRKNATPQENKLWYEFLRKHPCRFTRQKTIDQYIIYKIISLFRAILCPLS